MSLPILTACSVSNKNLVGKSLLLSSLNNHFIIVLSNAIIFSQKMLINSQIISQQHKLLNYSFSFLIDLQLMKHSKLHDLFCKKKKKKPIIRLFAKHCSVFKLKMLSKKRLCKTKISCAEILTNMHGNSKLFMFW